MLHLSLDNLISEGKQVLPFQYLKFNGGEINITIEDHEPDDQVIIETSLINSEKIMELFIATDALRRMGFKSISLFAPYLPYARQDRVCNPGESLSIKVMCQLINFQRYRNVYTLDNHSEVSTALLNNHVEIDVAPLIKSTVFLGEDRIGIISPDAGALKRTFKIAKALNKMNVIECSKQRNVATGAITATKVHNNGLDLSKFDKLLIVDDICDGGRTFIELAKVLRAQGAKKIELFVSHGIFSQGLGVFKDLIDNVHTTMSFKNEITDALGVSFTTPERY